MSKDIEMLEESSSKRLVAAHFDGDTSGYSVGGHEHFAGENLYINEYLYNFTCCLSEPKFLQSLMYKVSYLSHMNESNYVSSIM